MMSSVVGSVEKVLIGHFQYLKTNKMNTLAGYLEKKKKQTVKLLVYRSDQCLGTGSIYRINFLTGKLTFLPTFSLQ